MYQEPRVVMIGENLLFEDRLCPCSGFAADAINPLTI